VKTFSPSETSANAKDIETRRAPDEQLQGRGHRARSAADCSIVFGDSRSAMTAKRSGLG